MTNTCDIPIYNTHKHKHTHTHTHTHALCSSTRDESMVCNSYVQECVCIRVCVCSLGQAKYIQSGFRFTTISGCCQPQSIYVWYHEVLVVTYNMEPQDPLRPFIGLCGCQPQSICIWCQEILVVTYNMDEPKPQDPLMNYNNLLRAEFIW